MVSNAELRVILGMVRNRDWVLKWKRRPESFLPYMARWNAQTVLSGSPASGGAQTWTGSASRSLCR